MTLPDRPTGIVPTPSGEVAYWRVGGGPGSRPPLLCVHGGPGLPHSYLEPLAGLSAEREVIFYDQSGCGLSERRRPRRGWTIEHFVRELAAVAAHLDLDRFHLFGNSWGGWLALEYVLGRPARTPASMVLSSSPPSVNGWLAGVTRLRSELPSAVIGALARHERAGTTSTPEYRDALAQFNNRHMCRTQPWPHELKRAVAGFGDDVYADLWGSSEFGPVTGALRDWDVTARLPEVSLPALVTGGRYDEAVPDQLAQLAAGLSGRLRIFPESSHVAFLEETDAYLSELSLFLDNVEAGVAAGLGVAELPQQILTEGD